MTETNGEVQMKNPTNTETKKHASTRNNVQTKNARIVQKCTPRNNNYKFKNARISSWDHKKMGKRPKQNITIHTEKSDKTFYRVEPNKINSHDTMRVHATQTTPFRTKPSPGDPEPGRFAPRIGTKCAGPWQCVSQMRKAVPISRESPISLVFIAFLAKTQQSRDENRLNRFSATKSPFSLV